MLVSDIKISEFIDLLSSNSPTPGGGSTAALVSTLGISLNNMVSNLTLDKDKYKDNQLLVKDILEDGYKIQKILKNLIEEDVKVYNNLREAYKIKNNDEDKIILKKDKIENLLKEATIVPFKVMEVSLKGLMLIEKSLGKINMNVISDLGLAALNLKTGTEGAWLNVLINLKYIDDIYFIEKYRKEGNEILENVVKRADKIYFEVLNLI